MEPCSDDESSCKRRKTNDYYSPNASPRKLTPRKILSPKKTARSPRKVLEGTKPPRKVAAKKSKEITNERVKDNQESNRLNDAEIRETSENYEVDKTPVIKEIVCSPDDWVFQKREKAKVNFSLFFYFVI